MMAERMFALLGDSILGGAWDHPHGGWGVRLVEKLRTDAPYQIDYMSASVSGHRTFDVLHQLCGVVIHQRPDAVLISAGVNDLQRHGVKDAPVDLTLNLRSELWHKLLDIATRAIPRVFVTSISPIDETKSPFVYPGQSPIFFTNQDVQDYNGHLRNWVKEFPVTFLDFEDRFDQEKWSTMMRDVVHPNAAGHAFLADLAYEFLKGKI
jgi:lysophospholipase L1-like esterase